jgi:hypothetical protein
MQDRPTALELLAAVRAFLEDEILPGLDGRKRFHALVAVNVLGIVERELASEEETLRGERTRLVSLLGVERPMPGGLAALRADVRELEEALAARIRAGDADAGPFADAVRAHVRETVVEKLRVANPRYLGL